MDSNTGFVVGGNQYNCLTWMDKMGSSQKAGNKGIPATPRYGAPIELTALLKLCLNFVVSLGERNLYPFSGVTLKTGKELSFKEWGDMIQRSFELEYWLPAGAQVN